VIEEFNEMLRVIIMLLRMMGRHAQRLILSESCIGISKKEKGHDGIQILTNLGGLTPPSSPFRGGHFERLVLSRFGFTLWGVQYIGIHKKGTDLYTNN